MTNNKSDIEIIEEALENANVLSETCAGCPEFQKAFAAVRRIKDGGWLPIESAPHFEEQTCLITDGQNVGIATQLEDGIYYHDYPDNYNLFEMHPTHWQPLPCPPKITGGNDE